MSESDKPVVSAAVEATSEAVSTITTSSSPLDILKDINPVPVVEEMVEEFGKMQQGKNKPTIVRKLASEFRAHVDDLRIKYYELKNKIIDLSKETKSAPSKFVAETAVLHSAFLVKMCHHQPNLLIASVALGAALPTAMISKRFGFFSGLVGGAVGYGFVHLTNALPQDSSTHIASAPRSVNAATTVFKASK